MKNILITGISRGIGKALADKFLTEGHRVYGTVRKEEDCKNEDRLNVYALDLDDSFSISNCTKKIITDAQNIDILINNAGVLLDEDDTSLIPDKLRKTLEVNVIGTAEFTETVLPIISKGGHIINISSMAGSLSLSEDLGKTHYPYHYPAYKISKCALNMYTRTLDLRLNHEKRDIIVSSIHPGWVKTNIGGNEAPRTPQSAADSIFDFAMSKPQSGQFWSDGEKIPW